MQESSIYLNIELLMKQHGWHKFQANQLCIWNHFSVKRQWLSSCYLRHIYLLHTLLTVNICTTWINCVAVDVNDAQAVILRMSYLAPNPGGYHLYCLNNNLHYFYGSRHQVFAINSDLYIIAAFSWYYKSTACVIFSWLILGLHPANERWRYFVTTSLIGWVQALHHHDPRCYKYLEAFISIYQIYHSKWALKNTLYSALISILIASSKLCQVIRLAPAVSLGQCDTRNSS